MRTLIAILALAINLTRFATQLLTAIYQQKAISVFRQTLAGKNLAPIDIRIFKVANRPLANIDFWFQYLKGHIDLVGPMALDFELAKKIQSPYDKRFDVAPGIITPYTIKRTAGIAHQSEQVVSANFVEAADNSRRIQILLTWILQRVLGSKVSRLNLSSSINLLGVSISNMSMQEALNSVMEGVSRHRFSTQLKSFSFVNADCVNQYASDEQYRSVLNSNNCVFADGVGIRIAARWMGQTVKGNVNGTDMFPLLCQQLAKGKKRVFLYGGKARVVEQVAIKLKREYPELQVAGYKDGYTDSDSPDLVCQEINQSNADILFVAMGAPLQEKWIAKHQSKLNVGVAMGVGGLFDFYSGSVSRAPEWLREFSLEWVWRLMVQPKDKAKRYLLGNPLFLFRVMKAALIGDIHSTSIHAKFKGGA